MPSQVKLSMVNGSLKGPTYIYDRFTQCSVGRAFDNDIRLHCNSRNKEVSLYHCIFEIDPPYIWIRALDPKNGTYVNNLKLSNEIEDQPVELRNGDEVQLGNFLFVVHAHENQVVDELKSSSVAIPEWIF